MVLVVCVIILSSLMRESIKEGSKDCVTDDDCIVFGKTGDCDCGCYNKDDLPSSTGGKCFCAAPTSCMCLDGKCEGVFGEEINSFDDCVKAGNPVMESYPRQCATPDGRSFTEEHCTEQNTTFTLTLADAKQIAIDSECGDRLKENYVCNEYTGTYWIDLDIEREGCNPACVVNVETREAEINWRCTGAITGVVI